MNIVWFKRDLRLHDHAALSQAATSGPILPLYILEPDLWQQPDLSHRHYVFLLECLKELEASLNTLGAKLVIKIGDAVEILNQLHQNISFSSLFSHQETWNYWTYQRDQRILKWAQSKGIIWVEPRQHGVFRRLKDRSQWGWRWYQEMRKPILPLPTTIDFIPHHHCDGLPHSQELGLIERSCSQHQMGGRSQALKLLDSFLTSRGKDYTKEMSSPVTAFESCSRLSPHFSFGTISIREAFQAAEKHSLDLKNHLHDFSSSSWPSAMRSFLSRLRWHCHFIQKLEDDPKIEFKSIHSAYAHVRPELPDSELFDAWKQGRTGFPMVDACMRALIKTGWINFRMRAMLVSFASYHLWLPWQPTAIYLAQLFIDYEPGIHYCQIQMQSGTTGINALRIYNPIKQSIDQDPKGVFIKAWIPELAHVSEALIHTPWKQPLLMNGYPLPIIDEKTARKKAADSLYSLRKNPEHQSLSAEILNKHVGHRRVSNKSSSPIKK